MEDQREHLGKNKCAISVDINFSTNHVKKVNDVHLIRMFRFPFE
jgi:hypothetical protein